MLCEKCQNDYPSNYYFATPTICKSCFSKLPPDEQNELASIYDEFKTEQAIELRVNFSKRFLASFIDVLILFAILIAFYKFVGFFDSYFNFIQEIKDIANDTQAIKELQEEFFKSNAINFAFPGIIYLFYFLSEAIGGISLGKYLLGLKIGNLSGEKASTKSLWIRYLVKNSSGIMTILWLITQVSLFNLFNSVLGLTLFFGFFLILGRNRQNLQDMIAKTAVYKAEYLEEIAENNSLQIKK